MHPKDDLLRAYIDRELPTEKIQQVREHLNQCETCLNRMSFLQKNAQAAQGRLDFLTPDSNTPAPSASRAYRNFRKIRKEPDNSMFKKRSFAMTIAVVAVLAIALSFPTVRAWASDFLNLFRVEEVTVITFDPQDVERSFDNFQGNQEVMEQFFKENLEVTEQGEVHHVANAEEAAQAAGFNPRLLAGQEGQLMVKPGMLAEFTIDQPTLQMLSDSAGVDVDIPEDLDGKVVTLEVPSTVLTVYGGCPIEESLDNAPKGCTTLAQMPSPSVNAPEGLDLPRFGQALLQVLGYSESEARMLSNSIDWTSTLVLPIPQGEGFTTLETTVDGVNGTFIVKDDTQEYVMVWVKGDMLYLLKGEGSLTDAQTLTASLN